MRCRRDYRCYLRRRRAKVVPRRTRVICDRVGSAAVTYSDGGYSAEDPQPIFTIVDDMLSQLLGPIRGAIMLARRSRG